MVFRALFTRVLMALSMLACVTSNVTMRGDWPYWAALREEKFQKKKATDPLQTNLRIFSIITAPKFLAPHRKDNQHLTITENDKRADGVCDRVSIRPTFLVRISLKVFQKAHELILLVEVFHIFRL